MKHLNINDEIKNIGHQEECLDLVDNNDCVVQTLERSYIYQNNLCSQMRSVWLFIKNKDGQFWIPRRSMKVQRLPGHLDGSVVGHVQAGETYDQAMIRETNEEIGIDLHQTTFTYLGKLTPHEHGAFCFSAIYEMELEEAPKNWNREEIGDWYWMTAKQIIQRCNRDEKFKDTLPKIIAHFYL
ncbi:NUDIX hydrolase [Candidatus Dependentiae bacterium]|nr:NUDIX hydrolase [Candidatus Dependentiae bacterium]